MVLGLTVFDMFPEDKQTARLFNRKAFWLHSLSCGLIAKFLALRIRKFIMFDPEEAFCVGLLHDIGKVVMEQYIHDDFHMALRTAQEKKISMFDAENETLGYNHTHVAVWLTNSWGFPAELQLPLIYHHIPSESNQFQDIIYLCHLSDWLCYELGMNNEKYLAPKLDLTTTQMLKLEDQDIEDLKNHFQKEMDKMKIFFDIAAN